MIVFLVWLTASGHSAAEVPREVLVKEMEAHQPEAAESLEGALEAGDLEGAATGLEGLRKEAPRFTPAAELHCTVEFERGKRRSAIEACRAAFLQRGSVHNQRHLAMTLAVGPAVDPPTERELEEASALALEASLRSPDDPETQVDLCDIAMIAGDGQRLQQCAARLDVLVPDDPGTLYFGAYAAAFRGRLGEARELLDQARAAGLSDAVYAEAVAGLEARRPTLSVGLDNLVRAVVAWLGLLFGLLVIGIGVDRANGRRATRARSGGPVPSPVLGTRGVLRGVVLAGYATGLGAAAGFFGAAALGLRNALLAPEVPWLLLGLGTAVVIPAALLVVRSVTVRFERAPDPGFPLRLDSCPSLRAALMEAAARVGTQAPTNVWLVPDARMETQPERSSLRLLAGGGPPDLLIGVALLDGLRARRFKALALALAEDPKSAVGFATAMQRALEGEAAALAAAGRFSPVAWLASWLRSIFARTSAGAAALAHAAADRTASEAFGSAALARGLRRQALRSARFELRSEAIVKQLVRTGGALPNLYAFTPESPPSSHQLAQAEAARLEGDRVRGVEDLEVTVEAMPGDDADAWALLGDRDGLEVELTRWFRKQLREDRGLSIPESSRTIPTGR
ncbi:MAG: hypothetical protein GY898_01265 [Proteobacteria bacterium]|nr:hypothetical protein [Pseudomonadota bacterium]